MCDSTGLVLVDLFVIIFECWTGILCHFYLHTCVTPDKGLAHSISSLSCQILLTLLFKILQEKQKKLYIIFILLFFVTILRMLSKSC